MWLVEDDGRPVVAYGLCWVEAPPGEIVAEQIVDPAQRGRGLSELLLRPRRGAGGRAVPRPRPRRRRQPGRLVARERRAPPRALRAPRLRARAHLPAARPRPGRRWRTRSWPAGHHRRGDSAPAATRPPSTRPARRRSATTSGPGRDGPRGVDSSSASPATTSTSGSGSSPGTASEVAGRHRGHRDAARRLHRRALRAPPVARPRPRHGRCCCRSAPSCAVAACRCAYFGVDAAQPDRGAAPLRVGRLPLAARRHLLLREAARRRLTGAGAPRRAAAAAVGRRATIGSGPAPDGGMASRITQCVLAARLHPRRSWRSPSTTVLFLLGGTSSPRASGRSSTCSSSCSSRAPPGPGRPSSPPSSPSSPGTSSSCRRTTRSQIHDPKDWLVAGRVPRRRRLVGLQAGRMREREARARGARAGDGGAQPAQRRGRLADVHRADGRDLPRRDRRRARRRLGDALRAATDGGAASATARRRPATVVDAAVEERARRRRPSEPARRRTASRRGSPAAGADGGLYVPVRSPSGVAGVLTVQARARRAPLLRRRRAPGHVARQPRRRVPRARAAAGGGHHGGGRARGRPASSPACSRPCPTSSRPRWPRSPRR